MSAVSANLRRRAAVFAALGDETRLAIVTTLADGAPQSATRLAEATALSRQAVAKHLVVLKRVGVVRNRRVGKENQFQFRPEPLAEMSAYLDQVSRHWDRALGRLKALVEG